MFYYPSTLPTQYASSLRSSTISTSLSAILYTNIALKLRNKLHGPLHNKIGVTCVLSEHDIYIYMNARVSGQCSYTIPTHSRFQTSTLRITLN